MTRLSRQRSVGVWYRLRSERKSAKRCEILGQEPVELTAQRLRNIAQGEGLAKPWVWYFGTRRSERAPDWFCTGAVCANRTALDDSHRLRLEASLCRSFGAARFLLPIPRVPPSLHPGLSSPTPLACMQCGYPSIPPGFSSETASRFSIHSTSGNNVRQAPGLSSSAASPLRQPTVRLSAKSDASLQRQGRWTGCDPSASAAHDRIPRTRASTSTRMWTWRTIQFRGLSIKI
jgi:hypothetical protein